MKRFVIDAGILFLYLIGDERVKPYFDEVAGGRAQAFICDVNLAEFYYKVCEKLGKSVAELRYHQIRGSGYRLRTASPWPYPSSRRRRS
jgi:predicted nucleic acid-binding protein